MKDIRKMSYDELENEIILAREREAIIEKELGRLIAVATEIKSKLCNSQLSLPLKIVRLTKGKSIPQKIVDLIKQNSGKFSSNDIYHILVNDGTYIDIDTVKRIVPAILSRLKGHEYIKQERNGMPWEWVKDYDRSIYSTTNGE